MITAKEFEERFGFEPHLDDLHRVNCDKAGEVGHHLCGICSHCAKPQFICNHWCGGDELQRLGLERVGDELFALPDEEDRFPVIRVFKPADVSRLGIHVDPNSVFVVRERALSDDAYTVLIDRSGVADFLHSQLTDETIHAVEARIKDCIMDETHKGKLFKDPAGKWRHKAEYWFGERQSRDLDRENF